MHQYLLTRTSQPENAYGRFAAEILRAEGLAGFVTVDIDDAGLSRFADGDLVLLTRCILRRAEVEALAEAVEGGARLVCVQPPWSLVKRFGWQPRRRVVHPGCVRVPEPWPGGRNVLQTHVPFALYDPTPKCGEIEVIAHAADADWHDLGAPAIARQPFGRGEVTWLFYDLPHAVARVRFGDPALASLLTTGLWDWPHATDLFTHQLDPRAAHLPQADLHGQLLAALLTATASQPLARLWYYPDAAHQSAGILSGDDDGSSPEQFDLQSKSLLQRGARSTYYLMRDTKLSDAHVQRLRDAGHTFGPHVNFHLHNDELYFGFLEQIDLETGEFRRRFGKPAVSLQCHCAPWMGHLEWADDLARRGYRMLLNYLTYSHELCTFMCGAGRPIRFPRADGTIVDCWQQPLTNYDDSSIQTRLGEQTDDALRVFRDHLGHALTHQSPIGMLSHPISFGIYSQPYMEGCWDMMVDAGVPLYSADQWCEFQDRRHAVNIRQHQGDDGTLHVNVAGLVGELPLMLPDPGGEVKIAVDGRPAPATRHRVAGCDYLAVALSSDDDRHASGIIEVSMETGRG